MRALDERPHGREVMIAAIQPEWADLAVDHLERPADSMPRDIYTVIEALAFPLLFAPLESMCMYVRTLAS
jgi:hypothetical protein